MHSWFKISAVVALISALSFVPYGAVAKSHLRTIRISHVSQGVHYFPLYVMQQKKILEKYGFDLELVVSDGPLSVQLFSQGRLDMVSALSPAYIAQAKGILAFEAACVIVDKFDLRIVAGKHIRTIQDLRGKKIGIAAVKGLVSNYALEKLLAENGISLNEITLVPEKSSKMRMQLVKRGIIDATVIDFSWALLEAEGYPLFELTGYYDYPIVGIGVLPHNVAIQKAGKAAAIETMQFMKDNPAETAALLKEWMQTTDDVKTRLIYEKTMETLTMDCNSRSEAAQKNLQKYLQDSVRQ